MNAPTIGLVVLLLLAAAPASAQETSHSHVNLHMAALQGDVEAIQRSIQAGADLNGRDAWGSTPLTLAALFGSSDAASVLIEAGADLEARDSHGSTPLHIAALFCRTDIVEALLGSGASMYARNNSGSTAYDIAASPFEDDKDLYDEVGEALTPLGLELDYQRIRRTRPEIAALLRPRAEDLGAVEYMPLPGDGWAVSTPTEQGLDPLLVAELYRDAAELETLYGLLVVKNDCLIAEKYFNEGSVEQLSKRASVTKSYTSALVGIALDRGCLSDVDQAMIEFFPEVADQITDPRKERITIRDMLQMRAGYPWEETETSYWDALWSGDYLHYIADFPIVNDPGTGFNYSNLTSHWLGTIAARACSTDLKSFGEEYLFSPLGAAVGNWTRDLRGYYIGGADIELTARDMAKFGMLYLNDGVYRGRQLVSAQWVRESLQNYSEDAWITRERVHRLGRYFRDLGYGYQWWSATVGGRHVDFAWGHGGQLIVLVPDHDMVIVVTADAFYGKNRHWESWPYEQANINLVGKFIALLPKG